MRTRTLALLFLFLLHTAESKAADKWTTVRSTNFTLVGNASESQIRTVAVELEQFRDAVSQGLSASSKGVAVPTIVVVFKNEETFRPFKPQIDNKPLSVTAFFSPAEDANYLAVTAGAAIPASVYHEYFHQLTREMPNTVPLWLSEGLAEFFSRFEIAPKEKQFVLGAQVVEYVDALKKNPFVSLEDLFAFDRSSAQYNERDRKGVYYAQSWALVNYMMIGTNGSRQPELAKFMNLLTEGKPVAETFQTAFKTDYKSMLGELDYYVRDKAKWDTRGIDLKDKAAIDKDIKTRALSDAEAEFYAGDLLLHMGRVSEAEPHFKQATTLDPKLAAAQSAMGMVLFRQEKHAEAVQYLKRAVDLDAKNYLAQYNYAYVLDKNSVSPLDDLDDKRSALGKAIESAPQYEPAYELLAYVNLTADIDYNGTIELLQSAYKISPGNANIKFLLSQALVKKEDFAQAEKILQTIVNNSAVDLPIRDGARSLINLIARKQAGDDKDRDPEPVPTKEPAAKPAETAIVATPVEPLPPANVPATPAATRAKSGELVAVNPQKVRPEGPQIKGMLTLVDCRGGLTLTVKSPTETLRLHSDAPDQIQFVSFVPTVSTSISCGPAPGAGVPVLIIYRPATTPGAAPEPIYVEFVEQ